ncbi:hypothetical protein [Sphingomonas sp.]|uniref:hypothetical protein n=1 Tax=Sphingomonas sp. TaxID=28214 RepID=UPI001B0E6538|nr:hypothetical protein [Sphingomonas sp.]MBO9712802.1 hypothetical protein [Sphingomonas sp.]
MITTLMFAALFAAAPAGQGQTAPAQDGPPKRIRSVMLVGDEKCPTSTDPDEIVVCATIGDSPYRIPKRFRDQRTDKPDGVAWGRRAEVVEEVNRVGMPGSCSVVGSYGQSGCTRNFIRQWAQDKLDREAKKAQETAPE